jgi:hypothetical protein
LLGDMGGLRPALGDYGITLGFNDTENLLGNVSGGVKQGATMQGVTTATLQIDTGKAFARDDGTREEILEIEVRGKRGVGHCKSMPGAVRVYKRLADRAKPVHVESRRERQFRRKEGRKAPPPPVLEYPLHGDHVFPGNHIKLFNNLLERAGLNMTETASRARLTACAIPISACASWKVPISTR